MLYLGAVLGVGKMWQVLSLGKEDGGEVMN